MFVYHFLCRKTRHAEHHIIILVILLSYEFETDLARLLVEAARAEVRTEAALRPPNPVAALRSPRSRLRLDRLGEVLGD